MVKVVTRTYQYEQHACGICSYEYDHLQDATDCETAHARATDLVVGTAVQFTVWLTGGSGDETHTRTLDGTVILVSDKAKKGALVEMENGARVWIKWTGLGWKGTNPW